MPQHCCVVICKSRAVSKKKKDEEGISFHVFPRDPVLRQQWIDATGHGRDWRPFSHGYTICSKHFEEKCYQKFKNSRRLFMWAIPTLKLRYRTASPVWVNPETPTANDANCEQDNGFVDRPTVPGKRCQHVLVPKNICTKCKKEFNYRDTDLYLGGRAKSIVAHVYDFFDYEFKEMKTMYGDTIDCSPFGKLLHRTSDATGVCLSAINRILKEECAWNEKRNKKRRKRWRKGAETSSLNEPVEELDASVNTCKKNCDSDCENQYKVRADHGTQTEMDIMTDNNFDINVNKMTQTDDTADSSYDINENKIGYGEDLQDNEMETEVDCQNEIISTKSINDSANMETQQEVISESQNCSLEPTNSTMSQPTSTDIENQPLRTTKEDFSSKDAVPMVVNIVITEEEFYKTQNLEPDDEVVTLETADVEFEFHGMDPLESSDSTNTNVEAQPNNSTEQEYCSAETSDPGGGQPDATDAQPLVTTEPQYYSLPINPIITQLNGPLVSTEPQYCSLETVNPIMSQSTGTHIKTQPLYTTEPRYCSLETLNPGGTQPLVTREPQYFSLDPMNPIMSQLNGTLVPSEPQYCSLERVNPIISQSTGTHIETQPLYTTEPQYCSLETNNPMLRQPATTHVETQPLVLTDQLYCSIDPTMTASTMLGQPNLLHIEARAQPLISSEPQYISTSADCQTMAALPRADFTDGLNYYVLM